MVPTPMFFKNAHDFLISGGTIYWIAGEGGIAPDPLLFVEANDTPNEFTAILERIFVRRGFTKDQLHQILQDLPHRLKSETARVYVIFSGFEPSEQLKSRDAKRLQNEVLALFRNWDRSTLRYTFLVPPPKGSKPNGVRTWVSRR
jgi:hypothetical protein